MLRTEDGDVITNAQGYPEYDYKEAQGFGICLIYYKTGYGDLIAFNEAPSQEIIQELLLSLEHKDVDSEKSYLSLWDKDTQQLNVLHGLPPRYDDFDNEDNVYENKEQDVFTETSSTCLSENDDDCPF